MNILQAISSNVILLAIANLVAAVAAVAIVYRVVRRMLSFLRIAYERNVKSAIQESRRKADRLSLLCATDIHYYISHIVVRSLLCIAAGLAMLTTQPKALMSRDEFVAAPLPFSSFSSYESYLEDQIILRYFMSAVSMVMFMLLFLTASRLFILAFSVASLRLRWGIRPPNETGSVTHYVTSKEGGKD